MKLPNRELSWWCARLAQSGPALEEVSLSTWLKAPRALPKAFSRPQKHPRKRKCSREEKMGEIIYCPWLTSAVVQAEVSLDYFFQGQGWSVFISVASLRSHQALGILGIQGGQKSWQSLHYGSAHREINKAVWSHAGLRRNLWCLLCALLARLGGIN